MKNEVGFCTFTQQLIDVDQFWLWFWEREGWGPPIMAMVTTLAYIYRQYCSQNLGYSTAEEFLSHFPYLDENQLSFCLTLLLKYKMHVNKSKVSILTNRQAS